MKSEMFYRIFPPNNFPSLPFFLLSFFHIVYYIRSSLSDEKTLFWLGGMVFEDHVMIFPCILTSQPNHSLDSKKQKEIIFHAFIHSPNQPNHHISQNKLSQTQASFAHILQHIPLQLPIVTYLSTYLSTYMLVYTIII